jgi:hypothetical protein
MSGKNNYRAFEKAFFLGYYGSTSQVDYVIQGVQILVF